MQTIQRTLIIFSAIVVFVLGAVVMGREKEERLNKQWEMIQIERFINRVCRSGSCSYEEYILLHTALNNYGVHSNVTIEEYREEQDMDKKTYYYLVPWEEVQGYLWDGGRYKFELGSVIRIDVNQKSRIQSQTSRYFGTVSGRE